MNKPTYEQLKAENAQLAAIVKERDQLAAKCAEMAECLKSCLITLQELRCYDQTFYDNNPASITWIENCIKNNFGKGWLSPEKKEKLREALEYCKDFVMHKPYGTQFKLSLVEQALDETK